MKFVHTADTHLGFEDLKVAWPDLEGRSRRAASIFRNYCTVVEHAAASNADFFLHGGDLFNKYYIQEKLAVELVQPLIDLSKRDIPVFIIPGNHEKSVLPFDLFHGAPNVFVFDEPDSVVLEIGGNRVCIAGFPFITNDSRRTFLRAITETGYRNQHADYTILLTHQAFDSAIVGPHDFVFSPSRSDTVTRSAIPLDFDYVAAGHIHRYQLLEHPLKPGAFIAYPGSVQRISYAEMYEDKGFIEGDIDETGIRIRMRPLPAHPMEIVTITAAGQSATMVEDEIRAQFWRCQDDLVLRFLLTGGEKQSDYPKIKFDLIRKDLPPVLECQFVLVCKRQWIMK